MPTVLMCDDDVFILRAAEIKVRKMGFEVVTAGDGEEAWGLLQSQQFDVLVTDRQMPRLDGVELLRRVRDSQQHRQMPVVMLTSRAHDLPTDVVADLVVDKPFSPRELAAQLADLTPSQPAR